MQETGTIRGRALSPATGAASTLARRGLSTHAIVNHRGNTAEPQMFVINDDYWGHPRFTEYGIMHLNQTTEYWFDLSPKPQALPSPVGRRRLSTASGVNHRGKSIPDQMWGFSFLATPIVEAVYRIGLSFSVCTILWWYVRLHDFLCAADIQIFHFFPKTLLQGRTMKL